MALHKGRCCSGHSNHQEHGVRQAFVFSFWSTAIHLDCLRAIMYQNEKHFSSATLIKNWRKAKGKLHRRAKRKLTKEAKAKSKKANEEH